MSDKKFERCSLNEILFRTHQEIPFLVKHGFIDNKQQYNRALKQCHIHRDIAVEVVDDILIRMVTGALTDENS